MDKEANNRPRWAIVRTLKLQLNRRRAAILILVNSVPFQHCWLVFSTITALGFTFTHSGHIFCKLGKRLNSTKSRFIFSQRNCLEDKNLFARETRWSFEAGLIRPQLSHFLLSHSSGCEIRIERLLADVGPFLLLILLMLKTRFKQIPINGTNALLLATANDSMRRSTIAKKRNQSLKDTSKCFNPHSRLSDVFLTWNGITVNVSIKS